MTYFSIDREISRPNKELGLIVERGLTAAFRCSAINSRAGSATTSYQGSNRESTLVFPTPSAPVITKRAIVL